jgi:hypothetical protein
MRSCKQFTSTLISSPLRGSASLMQLGTQDCSHSVGAASVKSLMMEWSHADDSAFSSTLL